MLSKLSFLSSSNARTEGDWNELASLWFSQYQSRKMADAIAQAKGQPPRSEAEPYNDLDTKLHKVGGTKQMFGAQARQLTSKKYFAFSALAEVNFRHPQCAGELSFCLRKGKRSMNKRSPGKCLLLGVITTPPSWTIHFYSNKSPQDGYRDLELLCVEKEICLSSSCQGLPWPGSRPSVWTQHQLMASARKDIDDKWCFRMRLS